MVEGTHSPGSSAGMPWDGHVPWLIVVSGWASVLVMVTVVVTRNHDHGNSFSGFSR